MLEFSFEIRCDRVLIREEEIQVVILGGLLLAGNVLPQEAKRALIERKVVIETRFHVLHGVEQRKKIEQLREKVQAVFGKKFSLLDGGLPNEITKEFHLKNKRKDFRRRRKKKDAKAYTVSS